MTARERMQLAFSACQHRPVGICRSCVTAAILAHAEAAKVAKELAALAVEKKIDNYTLQNCCICYGGDSFPTKMRDALECHQDILAARIRNI